MLSMCTKRTQNFDCFFTKSTISSWTITKNAPIVVSMCVECAILDWHAKKVKIFNQFCIPCLSKEMKNFMKNCPIFRKLQQHRLLLASEIQKSHKNFQHISQWQYVAHSLFCHNICLLLNPKKKIVETHSEEQQHTNFSISQNLVTVPILFASCGVISNSQAKLHNAVLNMAFGIFFFAGLRKLTFWCHLCLFRTWRFFSLKYKTPSIFTCRKKIRDNQTMLPDPE